MEKLMKRLSLLILFALMYAVPLHALIDLSFFNSELRSVYISNLVLYKVSPTEKYDPVDALIVDLFIEKNFNIYSHNIENGLLAFEIDVLEWLDINSVVTDRQISKYWKLNDQEIKTIKEYYLNSQSVINLKRRMKKALQLTKRKQQKKEKANVKSRNEVEDIEDKNAENSSKRKGKQKQKRERKRRTIK